MSEESNPRWFFPLLGGGEEQGLNDPGISSFKKDASLARETCQNIGDVWESKTKEPAVATFEMFEIPAKMFPGRDQLLDLFKSCKSHVLKGVPDGTGNERKFFDNAINILTSNKISILRIRDENTSGLIGEDDDRRKPFFRLLKGQGASSYQGGGGGTYGIGQRAPFAHSPLRTVLYSTKTKDGVAFIGKCILASFRRPSDKLLTQNKGWWCNVHDELIGKWSTLRNGEVPKEFLRDTIGTDIMVTGFASNNWKQAIRHSILQHFFAAIAFRQLVVQLKEGGKIVTRIDQKTLAEELLAAANEARKEFPTEYKRGLGATLYYHKAIENPHSGEPYTTEIEELGLIKLYIYHEPGNEDLPNRWAKMRKPLILVGDHGSGQLNNFAAVLICDTKEGNEYLASLEDYEHKKWDTQETRQWTDDQKKKARKVLAQIRGFVIQKLKEIRGADQEDIQDLPFLGNYLPATEDETEDIVNSDMLGSDGKNEKESGSKHTRSDSGVIRGVAKPVDSATARMITNGKQREPIPSAKGRHRDKPGSDSRMGNSAINFRSCFVGGVYKLVLSSAEDTTCTIHLNAVGESKDYDINIIEALDNANQNLDFEGSRIKGVILKANERTILKVKVDEPRRVALKLA